MSALRILLRLFLLICTTSVILACEDNSGIKDNATLPKFLPANTHDAYSKEQGILLFSFRESIKDSEAYADWAEYLNNFSSNKDSNFYITEITEEHKITLGITDTEFSIFLKKGKASYYYDGLIVEPQVYTAVRKQYSGIKLSNIDNSFLPQSLCDSHSSLVKSIDNCINNKEK